MLPALPPAGVSASPPPFQPAGKDIEGRFPQPSSCPGFRDSTGQPARLLFHFILLQKAQLLIPQRSLSLVCRSSFSWLSAHRSPSLPDYVAGCTAAVGAVPFLKIAAPLYIFHFAGGFLSSRSVPHALARPDWKLLM